MHFHRNAKLGLAARRELVLAVAAGASLREAARTFNVSVATAHRWSKRWSEAPEEARQTLTCLLDRSSCPHHSPRRLAPNLESAICECRRRTGWGPRLVAGATGFAHSTVWKVLRRFGLSRPPRPAREPANRYEWPCPGDLLHMDVSEYVRFRRPGHRMTGDRRSQDSLPDGIDYVHAVVDDHSRLAYAEVLRGRPCRAARAFLERALVFYAEHAISVRRVMTDNAWAYIKGRSFRELLASRDIRHRRRSRTARAPTARSSASTRRWRASGHTASSTARIVSGHVLCHTGSTTTTAVGRTARSEVDLPSAAFTTS